MARLAISLTIIIVTRAPANAEVAVDAGVPFTAHDLIAALALRGASMNDIAVRAVSRTVIELRTAVGAQRVDLGAARGPTAARLVALQLVSFGGELEVAAGPGLAIAAHAPAADLGWTFGVGAGGGHGTAMLDFALTALRAEAMHEQGPWRWGGGLGWLHGLAKSRDAMHPATADLALVHILAGFAIGGLEVVAGPELVPYWISAPASGVTVGAGGSVRLRLTGGPRWRAIASADADGFLHRVIVERDGVPFVATPRVALTASLGVVWGGR